MNRDREELTEAILDHSEYDGFSTARKTAEILWAAGWRKKPSAAELVLVLVETNGLSYGERADAILALMDGPTETGDN